MAISPRGDVHVAPLLARVILALQELMWELDVALKGKKRKKGIHLFHGATLGFPPKFGGFAGRVGWKRGTKQLPCPFKSFCWCNGILDLAAA